MVSTMRPKERLEPDLLDVARRVAVVSPGGLRFLRKEKKMTLADVKAFTGLAQSAISMIESGQREVPDSTAGLRYAQWLFTPQERAT
jgi:hypothetical protein